MLIKTVLQGSRYLELWPEHPVIGAVFPEGRVKYYMRWGKRLIPQFIVFLLLWNFVWGGGLKGVSFLYTQTVNWPLCAAAVIFLLLICVHAYYWAGRRSQLQLNAKQQIFYRELCVKLEKTPQETPVMYDLAVALKEGLARLDPSFLDKL